MNAVIYARFSSHNQREQSIEGQLRDCYEYAKRYDIHIVGEYIDRAISGMTDDRPDFQRMIADASKKQFERIIVWKLDRFARNRYDSALYKHKLKQYGVRVISAMENVGEGDESILLEALLEASAEYYSLDLRKKIKRGQRENISKGKWCGGQVPYGYKTSDGKLIADEKKAPAIRYLFEQYAAGVSMKKIIDELKDRGVRGARGGELTYTSFSCALTNSVYIGKLMYKGEVIEGIAEPLIDEETFNKAQIFVRAHAHAPAANKAKTEYLLHGKAFCGHCGSHMTGECGKSRSGDTHHYYTCADRKKKHSCRKKNEKKDFIEWYVVEQTLKYVLTPARMDTVAKIIIAEYDKEFAGSKVEEYEKAIKQYDHELNKLVDALIDAPKVAHKRIYEKMELLDQQKLAMENELVKLRIASEIRFSENEVKAWLKSFCNGDPDDPEFRRNIIDTFINCVYLYDDRIVMFYNIKGGKQVSYIDVKQEFSKTDTGSGSDLNANAPPRIPSIAEFTCCTWYFFISAERVMHFICSEALNTQSVSTKEENMNNIQTKMLKHWDAYIYEQNEDETAMAKYIVQEMGDRPLCVLEAACGSGKLCIPLAQAGHEVTGIDQDENILQYLYKKSDHLPNLHILHGDMLTKPWGTGYDAVILGANLMVNIATDRDCKRAQINLLDRAHEALKTGGRLFIDYDCPLYLSQWTPANTQWVCFEGTDDQGTYGRYMVINGTANDRTRIVTGSRRWEITPAVGEPFVHTENSNKYFPPLEQLCAWLYRTGFLVESVNGGYCGEPFTQNHRRAVIWARKGSC